MKVKKDYVIVIDQVIAEAWFSGVSDEAWDGNPHAPSTQDPELAARWQSFAAANKELKALVSEYPSTRFRLDVLEPMSEGPDNANP
ncbi:hypothetical protein [Halomonas sp. MES3-P3E]|uniref:hypothetical protein n=1 Tax=Halomonas sp. MES3-P3E TaxID=2058321 RepID=UPI000C33C722|nr:hypothetical protein [Halomonas sp. MES3-P3E]PKG50223.1 hypothetical protein CXF87_11750 [Halomonas sp. MES3-P3E]